MTSSNTLPTAVAATPVLTRPRRSLDMAAFRAAISASRLCQPALWPDDIDQLCGLYVTELTTVLDRLVPLRPVVFRRRPTDPWFDAQ
jgi:hypothetical protein